MYGKYGHEIYRVLQENPYRLADDMNGIGFRMADEIASRAGIRYRFGFPHPQRHHSMCCCRRPDRDIRVCPMRCC